jgi:hypothetical protein
MFYDYCSKTRVSGFRLYSGEYAENKSTDDISLLKEHLTLHVKNEIRTELESRYSGEIKETVYSIRGAKNLSEAQGFRNSFIESVYRQVNSGGARIVLSLWNSSS